MDNTFERNLNILSLTEAIERYNTAFPGNDIYKLQIESEGPFIKYEFVGTDGRVRNTYEFNATTGDVLKQKSKDLRPKQADQTRLDRKRLNLTNLLPLAQIDSIAKEAVAGARSFQWELDRNKDRTIWKVELVSESLSQIHEVKIDAQDGTIVQTKLKN